MVSETVNRKTYLDALRVLAAFLVIFNHTEGFHLFLEQAADGSAASWLRVMLSVFTKINVPVFFMISGALLLGREESYGVLLRKRVARFLSVLVLFSLVIYLDRNPESRDMSDFVYGLFSGEINLSYWFLYAYLGMLLALPFLRKIAGKLALSDVVFLFVLRAVFCSLIPLYGYWAKTCGIAPLTLRNDLSAPFGTCDFLFYPLVGYYLANGLPGGKLGRREAAGCLAVLLGGILASAAVTCHEGANSGFTQDYLGLFTYSSAAAVFLLARILSERFPGGRKTGILLAKLGGLTFGVYLLEPLLNTHLYYAVGGGLSRMLYSFLWCFFAMAVCGGITFVLKKIPLLGKLL